MLKKLLIPFVVVAAAAAVGCGSSSSSTGAGGSGGSAAGSGGSTAGSGGSTAGSGGSTAGSGGSTAGSGGSAAGTDGGAAGATAGTDGGAAGATAGTDGGAAGSEGGTEAGTDATTVNLTADEALCVTKRTQAMSAVAYSAEDFCAVYMDICGATAFTGSLTSGDCITTYTGWAGKNVAGGTTSVQSCASYHLCNAQTMDKTVHCPHAAGMAPCAP